MAEELVIKPVSKSKPGYLRRQLELARIRQLQQVQPYDGLMQLIDFTLENAEVSAPKGVDAREALLDLSEEDYSEIIKAMSGEESAVPPESAAR